MYVVLKNISIEANMYFLVWCYVRTIEFGIHYTIPILGH